MTDYEKGYADGFMKGWEEREISLTGQNIVLNSAMKKLKLEMMKDVHGLFKPSPKKGD